MNDEADYKHFSQAVAPLLAAFTLPTIAVIVTTPASDWNRWRYPILSLFLASTGLLLASVQFSAGSLFKPCSPWNEIRAGLAFSGLICLAAGLALLVSSQLKADDVFLIVALVVFAAGVLVPMGWSIYYRITDPGSWLAGPVVSKTGVGTDAQPIRAGAQGGFRAFCNRRRLSASSTPQLERAWDAWQAGRYQRGEIDQQPGYVH